MPYEAYQNGARPFRGPDPVGYDYDARLPSVMKDIPGSPEGWIPQLITPAALPTSTSGQKTRNPPCLWKICNWRVPLPKSAEVTSWVGDNVGPAIGASVGYLVGANGTLGLPAAAAPGSYNSTSMMPAPSDYGGLVWSAYLPPLVMAGVAAGMTYGGYRACKYFYGEATPPDATQEAVPLQAV